MKLVTATFIFALFYIIFIGYFIYTHDMTEQNPAGNNELVFSSDSKYLASVNFQDHTLKIVETSTGKEVKNVKLENNISALSFSPDDRFVAYKTLNNEIRLIEVRN